MHLRDLPAGELPRERLPGVALQIPAIQRHGPLHWQKCTGQGLQHGRFARTVRPDQHEDPAPRQLETEPIQHDTPMIPRRHIAHGHVLRADHIDSRALC